MSKANMSEEIKAQVQKVYDARQVKNQVMKAITACEPLSSEWSDAVDQLAVASELVAFEQHTLASLLIESLLGKSPY